MSNPKVNIISLEKLDNLFFDKVSGEKLIFKNIQCLQCRKLVDIEINKTSGGYGFSNGIISETLKDKLLGQCSKCNGYKDAG